MSRPAPTIRRAVAGDAEALAAFAARVFLETFGHATPAGDMAMHLAASYGAEHQSRELQDPDVTTLVAECGGALCAYAQLRTGGPPACVPAGPVIELWRFYLDARWHGTGLAQALMREVKTVAIDRGASQLWLSMWEHNHRARRFYERCGFREVGRHPFVLGTVVDNDYIFVAELDPVRT